jgi:thiol:disulfide interchange protein
MKTVKYLVLAGLLCLVACKEKNTAPAAHTIYPQPEQAQADLSAALKIAATTHKRVLLDFGGNWCPDCKMLDLYFHDEHNKPLLDANYVLVHVNIGHMDANLDLADKYQVPLKKGVPALAVLDEHGALIYSQRGGEFEAMRSMQSSSVTEFLAQWRQTSPCSVVQVSC